ncbi:histone-lysine N-methyltransferase, H3 lysine-79 specific-like [Cotesia glomerata]|uniref:histone-lysine N-methyltransferase, H3 lysine-79 specific-like n=1 Tax=Cotesia glomerata TaxID=32391 RepID=UPI001D00AF54|nr:histone-lysine N-methyltransferase, H3 lysine-79 specific-like [Cotesia glomerata]
MERLNCFLCHRLVSGELSGLKNHFVNVHGLTVSQGVGDRGFKCDQGGCCRRFLNFSSLRRHIKKIHLHNQLNHNDDSEMNVDNNNDNENDNRNDNNIDDNDHFHPNNDGENNNNNNNNRVFDMSYHIVRMIGRFQCKPSMTTSTLTDIVDECEELLVNTCDFLRNKVNNFFIEQDLIGNDEAKDILKAFDLSNVFDGLRRFDGQITALEQSCQYIKPVEIPLGRRMDNKLNRITGTYQPTSVMDTFQYVPIIETLKLDIYNPNVLEAILHEQKSPEGILSSFLDEQHAETHEFLQQHPHALRLQLYYDELEIVNPLGSKTGIHKLGAFYYSIQNIPPQITSDLNSIHVLALCADVDVKKYGFKAILQPFLNDLEELESDAGILVNTENGPFIL